MNIPKGRVVILVSTLLIVAAHLTSGTVASAQVSAAISGRISDSSGSAVPGTTITVTNAETGAARTAIADAGGNYEVLSLPIGRYEVKADKTGFKTSIGQNLDLVVGQQLVVNLALEIGEVQQSVTVTTQAPVVNTTTAAVSGLVGEAQVKDLPLNGRSFDNLIALNPGAINYTNHTSTAATGGGSGNTFEVEGRRPSENLFLMNGVELTGSSIKEVTPGGASGQLLGIDGVREFNLLSDSYSAQYGKRPGGQVVVVTQSGTNQIHGSAFEFLRNSDLDARNFFDAPPSQIGHRIPEFQRNQFGGSLGGPIRKDKVFVFGNYEGYRQRLGVSDVAVIPDNNARIGKLPCGIITPLPSGCSGTTDITPMTVPKLAAGMLPFFQLWPQANGTNLGSGFAINLSSPKQSVREDYGTTRVDENLSSRDSLSEVYTVTDGYNDSPQANPLFIGLLDMRAQVASLQETHIFSHEMINTARFGYSRAAYSFNVPPVVAAPPGVSLFAGLEPGQMVVGGGNLSSTSGSIAAIGNSNAYIQGARNLFTYTDDFQLIKGKHQLSFGVWFQRLQDNRQAAKSKAGAANFTNLETLLQGTVSNFQGVPNPTATGYRMLMGAWYAEDNIALRHNLTLRIGVRHEFTNGWNEAHGRIANFDLDSNGVMETNPVVGQSFTQNNAKWLFGPRAALAWDVFGNGKTAIRAGFGTHYYLQDNLGFSFDKNPPFNGNEVFGQKTALLPLIPVQPGNQGIPSCGVGVPSPCIIFAPGGYLSTGKTPTVEEWNLMVEQQINPSTSFRIAYVGSHGFHEVLGLDLNSIHPQICAVTTGCVSGGLNTTTGLVTQETLYVPVGTRPNPFLGSGNTQVSDGLSSYQALQLDLTHRLSKGLQFRANFTWSKNMDIQTEASNTQATNDPPAVEHNYDPKADWGPSAADATRLASVSAIYDLPIGRGKAWLSSVSGAADKLASGWQVNSIVTLVSGLPITPQVGSNQSGDGNSGAPDRVSLNPAFSGPIIIGSPNGWFNTQAFSIPNSGTYGNVSRGSFRGPGLADLDMSLFKNTSLTERYKLQFRAEAFNILNRSNFNSPNPIVFSGTSISPSAGLITATATTSRQIQFGLKLVF
jgi:hypothetical protein